MSPDVFVVGSLGRQECDVGVCALCSTGIRSVYDSDVYWGVITVGMVREIMLEVRVAGSWCRRKFVSPGAVLSRPGAPVLGCELYFVHSWQKFVTKHASRTPVSAQPQLDVIQLCLSSSRSGWLSLLSGAGMLLSAGSVLLRWDFLCIIRTIARCRLRAQKGPLYDYACVRSEYTNGHHTVIDEWLFRGTCCIWCLDELICCSGLSDRVFRCSRSHHIPRCVPGMSRLMLLKWSLLMLPLWPLLGYCSRPTLLGRWSPTDQDATLSPTNLARILFPADPAGVVAIAVAVAALAIAGRVRRGHITVS